MQATDGHDRAGDQGTGSRDVRVIQTTSEHQREHRRLGCRRSARRSGGRQDAPAGEQPRRHARRRRPPAAHGTRPSSAADGRAPSKRALLAEHGDRRPSRPQRRAEQQRRRQPAPELGDRPTHGHTLRRPVSAVTGTEVRPARPGHGRGPPVPRDGAATRPVVRCAAPLDVRTMAASPTGGTERWRNSHAHPTRPLHRPPPPARAVAHRAVHDRRRRHRHAARSACSQGGGFDDPELGERARRRACSTSASAPPTRTSSLVVTATDGDVDAPAVAGRRTELVADAARPSTTSSTCRRTGSSARHRPCAAPAATGRSSLAVVDGDDEEIEAAIADIRDLADAPAAGRSRPRSVARRPSFTDIGTTIEGDLGAGRADRRPDHPAPAARRVRRSARGVAAAVRRRHRRARHVPVAARHRLDHRRVDLRHQPDDRPRPRPGDRLQPVHRRPATARSCAPGAAVEDAVVRTVETAGRTVADQRAHRRRVAGRAARVPAVLPALVRLRRHRRRAAGDGRLDRRPAGAARRRRHPHRRPARAAPPARRSAETTASGTAPPAG